MIKRDNKIFIYLILIVLISFTFTSCTSQSLPPTVIEEIYLNVPVVKQPIDKTWCFLAATKSVMNYYDMEITQEELAEYILDENGLSGPTLLKENADKLGIEADDKMRTLEEIKDEIKKGKPVIVVLDYSLEMKGNHSYVIDGFNEEGMRLMCLVRGFVYWSYDYLKQLIDNFWIDEIGETSNLYNTALIQPKD